MFLKRSNPVKKILYSQNGGHTAVLVGRLFARVECWQKFTWCYLIFLFELQILRIWHFHVTKGVNRCVPISLVTCKITWLSLSKQTQNEFSKFFMIWIFKSWTLEVWRWTKNILLGIYSNIIFHSNDLGSKHLIDQFTFKKLKSKFFNFDITKVAWWIFLPS